MQHIETTLQSVLASQRKPKRFWHLCRVKYPHSSKYYWTIERFSYAKTVLLNAFKHVFESVLNDEQSLLAELANMDYVRYDVAWVCQYSEIVSCCKSNKADETNY
jgi:hypothetical protein